MEYISSPCSFFYKQLVFLFHDHQCKQCERTNSDLKHITLPSCHSVGALLSHIRHCRAGMSCKIPSCRSSRKIVSHATGCRKLNCAVVSSLNAKHVEWTRHLQQRIGVCSSNPKPDGWDVAYARKHLFLMIYAMECATHPPGEKRDWDCTFPQCHTMKNLLRHFSSREDHRACLYPMCATSRILLLHCKSCELLTCKICRPLDMTLKVIHGLSSALGLVHMLEPTLTDLPYKLSRNGLLVQIKP
ncbi:uncharacterized protein [Hyperolius riggenbachi]|uniref:uncharacterized protein isoform X2 n=1 Tax=Hyperolius riggenbachi TaxID=752182 RepID=UPI0035A31C9F